MTYNGMPVDDSMLMKEGTLVSDGRWWMMSCYFVTVAMMAQWITAYEE